jgi:hypothetical protein
VASSPPRAPPDPRVPPLRDQAVERQRDRTGPSATRTCRAPREVRPTPNESSSATSSGLTASSPKVASLFWSASSSGAPTPTGSSPPSRSAVELAFRCRACHASFSSWNCPITTGTNHPAPQITITIRPWGGRGRTHLPCRLGHVVKVEVARCPRLQTTLSNRRIPKLAGRHRPLPGPHGLHMPRTLETTGASHGVTA